MVGKKIEWYLDFFDESYRPKNNEIIALFYFEPIKGMSKEEAAGRIASESSVGTWTTLPYISKNKIKHLMAKAFFIKKYKRGFLLKVSYPLDLWEKGSIPQLLSGIGGNIFGMKAVKNLRLIDIHFPKEYLKPFKGPYYGKRIPKEIFKDDKKLIITSTVIKPKVGLTHKEHAETGYQLYIGGIDAIKDDENLTNLSFNKFKERVKLLAKARDKAEKETGHVKEAFLNVTSPNLKELEKRIELVHSYGFKYFMIDVVISGFTAVQTATDLAKELKMAIHGHRAMHAMMTRNPKHGISMHALAKVYRIMGVDQLHIGTVVGKLEGKREEVRVSHKALYEKRIEESLPHLLEQDFFHINQSLPVSSGGLHPGLLHYVFNLFGVNKGNPLVIQVGGGTLGHPKGPTAGAKAVIQAIEAYMEGVDVEEYAEKHKELKIALKKWGKIKPV